MLSDVNRRPRGNSEGSGVGDLWWYACMILEINSDMGVKASTGLDSTTCTKNELVVST